MDKKIRYFLIGKRPIKWEKDEEGMAMYVMDWDTGEFSIDNSYLSKISNPQTNYVKEIEEEEFNETVEPYKVKAKTKSSQKLITPGC